MYGQVYAKWKRSSVSNGRGQVYASASAGAREKDSSTLVEVHTRRGGETDKHLSLFKALLVLL